jgi:hypothetical protein
MAVEVEIHAGVHTLVSDAAAKKIIEHLISLCEDLDNLDDGELRVELITTETLLAEFNLIA